MKKFTDSVSIEDYEIFTDTGWVNIEKLLTTIPFKVFEIKTSYDLSLKCADNHILFLYPDYKEVFVKDLELGDKIFTKNGVETVLELVGYDLEEIMYDLQLPTGSNHRYYTNGILSHNSTFFNILAGLLKQDSGEILINKNQCPVQRGDVGVVFQNYFVYDWRKVIDIFNISIRKNPCIKESDRKDYIKSVASDFDIYPHLQKYPNQLSGGQKQRVAIAEQIINGGEFILFDEPFSGLDALVIDKVTNMLLKVSVQDELKTLVIVSHDLINAVAISDTVFVMGKEQGKDGAIIKKEIDLIERDLCWQPDVKNKPGFMETIKEIKSLL